MASNFFSGKGGRISIDGGPSYPISYWEVDQLEIRVFLLGKGELELLSGRAQLVQDELTWDRLDTTYDNPRPLSGLSYYDGGFHVGISGTSIHESLFEQERWKVELTARRVWIFHRFRQHLFPAIIDSLEATVDRHANVDTLLASFRSCGPVVFIPTKMQSHLGMIVAFEDEMPANLGMYRDWTE